MRVRNGLTSSARIKSHSLHASEMENTLESIAYECQLTLNLYRIYNEANRMLGFLNRNLYHAPQHIKEYTYKTLVLPSVDYCSAIWDPYSKKDVSKLEMLQH